jgi:hypothetical protein
MRWYAFQFRLVRLKILRTLYKVPFGNNVCAGKAFMVLIEATVHNHYVYTFPRQIPQMSFRNFNQV